MRCLRWVGNTEGICKLGLMSFVLVTPNLTYLPSYIAALQIGWLPNNLREQSAAEELARIEADAQGFIDGLDSRGSVGETIPLPDGTRCRAYRAFASGCGMVSSAAR
jgi:hypothetical protein